MSDPLCLGFPEDAGWETNPHLQQVQEIFLSAGTAYLLFFDCKRFDRYLCNFPARNQAKENLGNIREGKKRENIFSFV